MKLELNWLLFIFLIVLCLSLPLPNAAQINTSPSPDVKRGEVDFQVKLQLLVASNIITAKTDYPAALETVVKQIKSTLPFKNHLLYATYLCNVADNGSLRVSDVSYKPYESGDGGGLSATFFNFEAAGIKLNTNGNSIHISKFKFEERKNIFIGAERGIDNEIKSISNTVGTGVDTELNVKDGVPTIVGTTTSALSDGILVIIITVNSSEM